MVKTMQQNLLNREPKPQMLRNLKTVIETTLPAHVNRSQNSKKLHIERFLWAIILIGFAWLFLLFAETEPGTTRPAVNSPVANAEIEAQALVNTGTQGLDWHW